MTRLLRYAEPYFWLILSCGRAAVWPNVCDLALPDYMSDIVNEGIATGDTGTIIGIGFRMMDISAECSA